MDCRRSLALEPAPATDKEADLLCPCGSGRSFDDCCEPILTGAAAPTAEALMRSRYTAYVLGNMGHIEATNALDSPGGFDRAGAERMVEEAEWLGLDVTEVIGGGAGDETGRVEFRARFNRLGQTLVHHEAATFVKVENRWAYFDGEMNPKKVPRRVVHVGRNDPCSCGSAKKFKKCCGT
jgi:SEC-C motif-containing protein